MQLRSSRPLSASEGRRLSGELAEDLGLLEFPPQQRDAAIRFDPLKVSQKAIQQALAEIGYEANPKTSR